MIHRHKFIFYNQVQLRKEKIVRKEHSYHLITPFSKRDLMPLFIFPRYFPLKARFHRVLVIRVLFPFDM